LSEDIIQEQEIPITYDYDYEEDDVADFEDATDEFDIDEFEFEE
jgi:hypothetical protein